MTTKKVSIRAKKRTKKRTVTTSAKRTSAAKNAKSGKALVSANDQQCFWTSDGRIIKDLVALRDVLKNMRDDVFRHHVTKEKNDFASWVEHVLQDAECAKALRKSKKATTARAVVVKYLRYYNI